MSMKTVDPKEMTVEQLKALAYDLISDITRIQNNLQIVNAEIANKQEVNKPIEAEVVKE